MGCGKNSLTKGILFLFCISSVCGQLFEKARFFWGASVGTGGVHFIVKPALDLHYKKWNATFSPGTHYLSFGLRKRFGRKKYCNKAYWRFPRWYLAYAYHRSYFLSKKVFLREVTEKVQLHNLILGLHQDLDYRRIFYVEGGIGAVYAQRTFYNGEKDRRIYPILEVRFGGILYPKKIRQQRLKPVEQIERELPVVEESGEETLSKKEQRARAKEEKKKTRELEKQYKLEVKAEAKQERLKDKEERKAEKQKRKEEKQKRRDQKRIAKGKPTKSQIKAAKEKKKAEKKKKKEAKEKQKDKQKGKENEKEKSKKSKSKPKKEKAKKKKKKESKK